MAFTYVTGSGTQADPYVITDINGWQELATYVRNGTGNPMYNEYVELGADIDFQSGYDKNGYAYGVYGSTSGSNIYSFGMGGKPFCGNFNGNNHKLERPRPDNSTLFYVSGSAVIKNINIIFPEYYIHSIQYGSEDVDSEIVTFENILICIRGRESTSPRTRI